jgi:hypothetical protein
MWGFIQNSLMALREHSLEQRMPGGTMYYFNVTILPPAEQPAGAMYGPAGPASIARRWFIAVSPRGGREPAGRKLIACPTPAGIG